MAQIVGIVGKVDVNVKDVPLANKIVAADINELVSVINLNDTATAAALDLKAPLASPTFTGTVSGVNKAMVGLPNADNTSDVNKPISTAQQSALNLRPLTSDLEDADFAINTAAWRSVLQVSNTNNTSDANKPNSIATIASLALKSDKTDVALIDKTKSDNVVLFGGVLKSGSKISYSFTEGKYLNVGGAESVFASYGYTSYIPVIAGKTYLLTTFFDTAPKLWYYDSFGAKQSYLDYSTILANSGIITIPSGINSLRSSYQLSSGFVIKANQDIVYPSAFIALESKIKTTIDIVNVIEPRVALNESDILDIETDLYTTQLVVKASDETLANAFIQSSGTIATGVSASYSIKRYQLTAGSTYKITGTSTVTTTASFTIGTKVNAAMSGTCAILQSIPNGTSSGTAYDINYVASVDTNLFVTQWTGLVFTIKESVKANKITQVENRVTVLENIIPKADVFDAFYELTVNPIEVIKPIAGLSSIFQDWGFIGDSLTSGQQEYKVSGVTNFYTNYDYSWGQMLCKLSGATGYNFSVGGQTAKGWCLGNYGLDARNWDGAQLDARKAYVVSMGTNDRNSAYGVGDVSTDVDITDYNNNADTYAGWMAGIIQRVRSIQPKCKIFLVTISKFNNPDTTDINDWNDVLRDLAVLFNDVFVIDIYNYGVLENSLFKNVYYLGGHMNVSGYQYRSYQIANYIDWLVRTNPLLFKQEGLVGTGFTY
jgi:hypothetical protein